MLTYAGVPLLIADPETAAWIANNISTADVYEFSRLHFPETRICRLTFPGTLPERAQPDRPVKVGSLFWPRGVSRWAVGHFLVAGSDLDAIRQAINPSDSYGNMTFVSAELVMDDEDGERIATQMFMLPPRPLAQNGNADVDDELYLLTLVDDRFFHWSNGTKLEVDENTTTWDDLFADLVEALDYTDRFDHDDIDDAYLFPPGSFASNYEYIPLLLDAVAYNVGQRLVRDLDGTLHSISADTALQAVEDNLSNVEFAAGFNPQGWKKLAGGLFQIFPEDDPNDQSSFVPSRVSVAFDVGSAEAYVSTQELTDLAIQEFGNRAGNGTTKIFHDVALGDGDTTPSNQTELDDLATQIATDWYRWQLGVCDLKLIGPVPWEQDGFHDVEWVYEKDEISTRIMRTEWNDLTIELMHASSLGSGTQGCGGGSTGTLEVKEADGDPDILDVNLLIINQDHGLGVIKPADHQAEIEIPKAFFIRFVLPSTLSVTMDHIDSCNVAHFWQGGDPGAYVTVYNQPGKLGGTNYQFTGESDYEGLASYDPPTDRYLIVELQHKARWIHFTLVATLAVTDASQANVTVNSHWDGESPGGTVTVYNIPASANFIFSGSTGKKGLACYDPEDAIYKIVQLEC